MRGLREQEFLVERTIGAVPFVGAVRVLHGTALFLRLGNALQELLPPFQQLFLELLNTFLFHSDFPRSIVAVRAFYRT